MSKRSFFDIPTGEIVSVLYPKDPVDSARRLVRKMKSGERRLLASDLWVLLKVIPSLDVTATMQKCYELEELRKMRGKEKVDAFDIGKEFL